MPYLKVLKIKIRQHTLLSLCRPETSLASVYFLELKTECKNKKKFHENR